MGRPKNGKLLKYLALIGFVFFMYVLQSMVFTHIEIWGTKPLLLPLSVVGIGLYEGSERGTVMGLVAGVFCDLSFNQATVDFTLFLTIVGLLAGILFERYLDKGFPSFIIVSALVLVLSAFVQMFSLFIYEDVPPMSLLRTMFIQTVYSMLFTVPTYYICRLFGRIPYRRF